jgi:two-component system phosphate regulon sensor histidine kinase PhoR
MNKKFLNFIITLVILTLITLVAIQFFWIRNAITVRETLFERGVNDAVSSSIYKLEKFEVAKQLVKFQKGASIYSSIDSLSKMFYAQQNPKIGVDSMSIANDKPIIVDPGQDYKYHDDVPHDTSTGYLLGSSNSNQMISQPEEENDKKGKSNKKPAMNRKNVEELLKQSTLLSEVFLDLFKSRYPEQIEKRINVNLLDSLLTNELRNKGIITPFEYGIYSTSRKQMVIERTGLYSLDLRTKGYRFVLFPNTSFSSQNYLMVYFPNQIKYVLLKLSWMLSASIVLIILLFLSFSYTIATILRQKKLSELKNDFINNMTHEFKTPISTISLACEALSDKEFQKSEELTNQYINIVSEENKRLGQMAEKILQTAILEKGELKPRKEKIDVHKVITDVIRNIGIQIEIRDGSITKNLKAVESNIMGDRVHLTNIIYNLLDNANKYTPRKPQISVTTENIKGGIVITIADNGLGISKNHQKKIFEKLYRVPTGDIHDVKGFGLGLSYVKFMVEKHGGKITLESELNKGSKFKIFLPFGN